MTQQEAIAKAKEINASGELGWTITHVAMDSTGDWCGYDQKPTKEKYGWDLPIRGKVEFLGNANDSWKKTLAEVAI